MNIDIYIIIFFIIIAAIIKVLPIKKESRNKIFINIGFIILFIILVIREPYLDMIRYIDVFKQTKIQTFSSILQLRWEPLYLFLNLIISLFTNNERIFIAIVAILGLIGPYVFIKRYSDNYLFSLIFFIILGIYNYNFYIIRQALAISILLIGIRYIEQKSLIKFLLIVLLATGFHTSSIVFLIAYPICNLKISTKGIMLYILLIIIAFIAGERMIQLIYSITPYSTYSERASISDGTGRLVLLTIIFLAMLILMHFKKEKLGNEMKIRIFTPREKSDKNTIFFNMLMIGIFFQVLAIQQSVVVRLANIFIAPTIALIPNVINLVERKDYKYLFWTIILICSILYSIFTPTINEYTTIF